MLRNEAAKITLKKSHEFLFLKIFAQNCFLNKNDKLVLGKGKEISLTVLSQARDKGTILSPYQE